MMLLLRKSPLGGLGGIGKLPEHGTLASAFTYSSSCTFEESFFLQIVEER
jgi:hypothetical protein